jgi:histidinol-phosphate/aromatic aminotransferase/cobyric acid decarboxylase-like protein
VPDSSRARHAHLALAEEGGVVVQYRGSEIGRQGCLRITVGTEEENIDSLHVYLIAIICVFDIEPPIRSERPPWQSECFD